MRRRVIKQGNDTLTITLPKEWTKRFGISAGDELNTREEGRNLVLSTGKDEEQAPAEITIDSPDKFLRRFISVLYRHGHDEIKVHFTDPAVIPIIQEEIASLLGLEIVEQGRTYCVLRNVAAAMESEFDTILRRIFLMLKTQFADLTESAIKGSYPNLKAVRDLERMNNKLVNFCQRTINKRAHTEHHKSTSTFYVVSQLEQVADDVRDVCDILLDRKGPLPAQVISAIKSVEGVYDITHQLYYGFTNDLLLEMTRLERDAIARCVKILNSTKGSDARIAHHLLSILRSLHHVTDMI